MKNLIVLSLLTVLIISCKVESDTGNQTETLKTSKLEFSTVQEEQFDIENDSLKFSSATIENFDKDGRSIDVYWIGEERDTTLRFYRKYNANKELIGAEYYEQGDTEPSRDTVFTNSDGLKVEASLNAENQISWKSITTTDSAGNPVLKAYKNGKDEYRGFDSLYFDEQNRVIKGFYENAKGKRYSIKTYEYTRSDEQGNWVERNMFVDDTLRQKHIRTLTYHGGSVD